MTMIQSLENYYYNIQEPMGKLFSSNLEATTTNLNYVQPMKPSLTHHLKRLRKVKLRESKVQGHFWRYQPYGEHCLATIEAIYYFFRQFIELYPTQALSTSPTIDDLLYFYSYFYHRIQENYRQNNSKTFTSKHVKNYIKY